MVMFITLMPLSNVNGQVGGTGRSQPIPILGFEGADVRSVLTMLGEYGDMNIVFGNQVTGQVTMQLRRVTWIEALEAVMSQLDLISLPDTETLRSGLPEGTTFVEILRRADFNNRQQQELQLDQDIATSQPLDTHIIRINHSTVAEIQTAIQQLGSPDGMIVIDPRTNSLIVRDYPDNLQLINEVIERIDIPVLQIRIEAKLLEVDTDKMRELGLNWNISVDMGANQNPLIISAITNLGTSNAITASLGFTDGLSLDATIAAMEQYGIGNTIATPSISVLDNARGRIFMGEQVPLRLLDVAGNVTITLQRVGTELIVTPHVVQDEKIILELFPKRESFRIDPTAGIIITTQEAETTVEVRDGETAVIGGLKSEQVIESITGIPILMNIPIIGMLFRYHTRSVQVRDLILFVTPHIQRESQVIVP